MRDKRGGGIKGKLGEDENQTKQTLNDPKRAIVRSKSRGQHNNSPLNHFTFAHSFKPIPPPPIFSPNSFFISSFFPNFTIYQTLPGMSLKHCYILYKSSFPLPNSLFFFLVSPSPFCLIKFLKNHFVYFSRVSSFCAFVRYLCKCPRPRVHRRNTAVSNARRRWYPKKRNTVPFLRLLWGW